MHICIHTRAHAYMHMHFMDACVCLHICCNNLLARKIQTKWYGKSRQNLDKVGPKPA